METATHPVRVAKPRHYCDKCRCRQKGNVRDVSEDKNQKTGMFACDTCHTETKVVTPKPL